jgi:hypothetical protein
MQCFNSKFIALVCPFSLSLYDNNYDVDCDNEEVLSRLNSGNSYCHSLLNILSSRILFQNLQTRMYRTTVLPAFLKAITRKSAVFGCNREAVIGG